MIWRALGWAAALALPDFLSVKGKTRYPLGLPASTTPASGRPIGIRAGGRSNVRNLIPLHDGFAVHGVGTLASKLGGEV